MVKQLHTLQSVSLHISSTQLDTNSLARPLGAGGGWRTGGATGGVCDAGEAEIGL